MKKIILLLTLLVICISITACGDKADPAAEQNSALNENAEAQDEETQIEEEPKVEIKTMTVEEFDNLVSDLPLSVVSTEYLIQDQEYKSLYPDMLQAVIKNNTESDIRNVVVAFAAWDENDLPVKIAGDIDFSDPDYVRTVNYDDINLVPGATYGEDSGYSIDYKIGIDKFKAIVVSCETFEGDKWENPYYDEFTTLYENKKFNSENTVDVEIVDSTIEKKSKTDEKTESYVDENELTELLKNVELSVVSTEYVVQDQEYKSLYPDMLQAIIKNNTESDIRDAVVAFVAWDENNLPVKIAGDIDFNDADYVRLVNYEGINLIPGATYGEDSGFSIDHTIGIKNFKAIVISYENFDGETWENPCYDQFLELYKNKRLQN